MAKKSTETNLNYKDWGLMEFSSKNKKCFLGTKCQKCPYLEKMAFASHLSGPISNLITEKTTDTIFKQN